MPMTKCYLPALAVVLLLLGGCVSAQTFRSGSGTHYPRTNPKDVLVFYALEDVKRPYEVIGEISTAGSSGWFKNEGDLTRKAQQEAAKLGAHAILLRSHDEGTGGDRAAAIFLGTNDKKQKVTALRFTDETSSPRGRANAPY
jgi:hypothetical protein